MTNTEQIAAMAERIERLEGALRPFVARAEQPGFEKAADDERVTFFVKDVRDAVRALLSSGDQG